MRAKISNTSRYQTSFLEDEAVFPSTRFQGSKLKIARWIWEAIEHLDFCSVLDAFGGTGSIAYMLKDKGKVVTYNDILKFNWYIGLALIENDSRKLSKKDIEFLTTPKKDMIYPTFVCDTFKDIYFTDRENHWIDMVIKNISLLNDKYKQAVAFFALFQACIIKRPFNLFHRKNLYLRFSDVKRNFGNKTTWDRPFEEHFRQFAYEANKAIINSENRCKALNKSVFEIQGNFDLVYIDTPYISKRGNSVDYLGFYHFLEGLANYPQWPEMIDYKTKHRRLKKKRTIWNDKTKIHSAFDKLFEKFKNSTLVISYRADGIPSISDLVTLLEKHKKSIIDIRRKKYKYALSQNHSEEVLLLAT